MRKCDALLNLGNAYRNIGKLSKAVSAYLQAIPEAKEEENCAGIHANIGACYIAGGKLTESFEHLDDELS